jgi:hypothetical protein
MPLRQCRRKIAARRTVNGTIGFGEGMMRLDAVSVPRIMLQVGFCGLLVAGTYLISQERPKDSARLLTVSEDGPFTLGTKGDRMVVALHQSTDEALKPIQVAMAPEAEKPAAVPPPVAAPKPKRVTVVAPPVATEHRESAPPIPAQTQAPVPASPAWTSQSAPAPAPIAAQPVMPPPPPPKPKPQETFLGLPPIQTPAEFFDNTVKETSAAFGKMKQAMEDAFR